jgi:hypothetical protein
VREEGIALKDGIDVAVFGGNLVMSWFQDGYGRYRRFPARR